MEWHHVTNLQLRLVAEVDPWIPSMKQALPRLLHLRRSIFLGREKPGRRIVFKVLAWKAMARNTHPTRRRGGALKAVVTLEPAIDLKPSLLVAWWTKLD